MLELLRVTLRAMLGSSLVAFSTLLHCIPLFALALLKVMIPLQHRRGINRALTAIAESWIAVNSMLMEKLTRTRFSVDGDLDLDVNGHYLVLANHQSWVDIPVLQRVLNRRIPLLRFFLKSQLFWVPILGLAWWGLDFPFMKRYTREQIRARPALAGRDIEVTRRACEKFRHLPVSIMNFVEGTRYTSGKHAQQASPYTHLLKPRAGGVAFVLGAMGDGLHSMLDITVVYPQGRPTLLDLLADRVAEVRVTVRKTSIPEHFVGRDYSNDEQFREQFQAWINQLWVDKDARIAASLAAAGQP